MGEFLRSITLAICLVFTGVQFAEAQDVPGDAAARAEAPHFARVTGKFALADTVPSNAWVYLMGQLMRGGVETSARGDAARDLILPDLHAAVPSLVQRWTEVYAAKLSANDMKAIESFYQTSAGLHLLASQTYVTNVSNLEESAWTAQTVRQSIDKHIEALRSSGYHE